MKIATSRFGEIEVPDEAVIAFPEGIIGFKEAKRFVIFDCGEDGIFKWLQCCDRPEFAFVICEASVIMPTYKVIIGQKEREILKLERIEDGVVCLILTIPKKMEDATANLLGPIVMNSEKRLGMQLILINPEYSTRHSIFDGRPAGRSDEEGNHARP